MSDKPEMSRQEASWHTHLAALRAQEAARKAGSNTAATEALATATAGPVTIGGYQLYPASEGTIWTLKRLAREFIAWADKLGMPHAAEGELRDRELLELALSTLAFCDARRVWQLLESGRFEELIIEADRMVWYMPIETSRALEAHFSKQMARIRELTPDAETAPKKPEAGGNGNSPATPIPAEDTDSPPSNGWQPNTKFC